MTVCLERYSHLIICNSLHIPRDYHLPRYVIVESVKKIKVTNKLAILVIIDYEDLINKKSTNMLLSINYIYIE